MDHRKSVSNIATSKEVGEYLLLTQCTVINLAMKGILPGFRVGKSWRFDMDEILKFIEGAKQGDRKL